MEKLPTWEQIEAMLAQYERLDRVARQLHLGNWKPGDPIRLRRIANLESQSSRKEAPS